MSPSHSPALSLPTCADHPAGEREGDNPIKQASKQANKGVHVEFEPRSQHAALASSRGLLRRGDGGLGMIGAVDVHMQLSVIVEG